jgi:O-antigen biosynthesis protein
MVRHRHREHDREFRKQALSYGIGLSALLTSRLLRSPQERRAIARRVLSGLTHALSPSSSKNALKSQSYPRYLTLLELIGIAYGPIAYFRSLKAFARTFAPRRREN